MVNLQRRSRIQRLVVVVCCVVSPLLFSSCQKSSRVVLSTDRLIEQGASPIRRLSNVEFSNSLRDALTYQFAMNDPATLAAFAQLNRSAAMVDVETPSAAVIAAQAKITTIFANASVRGAMSELPQDVPPTRLSTPELDRGLHSSTVSAYVDIAAAMAQLISSDGQLLPAFTPNRCASTTVAPTEACKRDFVRQFGRLLFRAPIEDVDADELLSSADDWFTLIGRMLVHPRFLLKMERGGSDMADYPNVKQLTAYELEARLASTYWKSLPDPRGLEVAASGAVLTPDGLQAEVARMLEDPRAKDVIWDFYRQWLGGDRVPSYNTPPTAQQVAQFAPISFAQLTNYREAVLADARDFVEYYTWTQKGTLTDLFTSPLIFTTDPTLASIYGVAVRQAGDAPRSNPKHPGILSRAIVTSPRPGAGNEVNNILRGVYITTNILGMDLGAPANAAAQNAVAGTITEATSTRQKTSIMTGATSCQGCHKLINPNGFSLAHYDTLGRYMDYEFRYDAGGNPTANNRIDSSGSTPLGNGQVLSFNDLPGFVSGALASGRISKAFARYYFRYIMAREEDPDGKDACLLEYLEKSVSGPNGSLRNMFESLPQSPCFRVTTTP